MRRFKVTVGQVFGKYVVLDSDPQKTKDGRTSFLCQCSCGKEEYRRASYLFGSSYRACKSCYSKHNYETYTKSRWDIGRTRYVGDLSGTMYSHIKQCARTRGVGFHVSKEDLWRLLVEQEFRCALSGVPIQLSVERKKSDPNFDVITASLDRKCSSGAYTLSNVQWVHKYVNTMKWSLDNDAFIDICKQVAAHNNEKEANGTNPLVVSRPACGKTHLCQEVERERSAIAN